MRHSVLLPAMCLAILAVCPSVPGATEYAEPEEVCVLPELPIDESSGVEVSKSDPDVFWSHNDDEGDDLLHAFNTSGEVVGSHRIGAPGIVDWEDLSSFEVDGEAYILCADTGNNARDRTVMTLYFVREPDAAAGDDDMTVVSLVRFRYEDGNNDCEGVAVDLPSKRILLASKVRKSETSWLYELPLDVSSGPSDVLTAKKVAPLGIPEISSMDISKDGLRAVILAYEDVYELRREEGQSWADAVTTGVEKVARLPRGQWEAVCYGKDDRTLFITKEKEPAKVLTLAPVK